MTKGEMKSEAIKRMDVLQISKNAIADFRYAGRINMSDYNGLLYWLDEEQKQYVDDFETKYGGLVYHVIRSRTNNGDVLSFLYIDPCGQKILERKEIQNGDAYAYVVSLACPPHAEFKRIRIRQSVGGLIRIS